MNAVINTPQIFTDNPTNPFYSANQTYVTNLNFNADNFPQMWTGIDSADTEPHGGSPTTPGQSDDLYAADYGMDPQVVDDPDYASTIISDMQSIPSLSIVMNPDDLFGEGAKEATASRGFMSIRRRTMSARGLADLEAGSLGRTDQSRRRRGLSDQRRDQDARRGKPSADERGRAHLHAGL